MHKQLILNLEIERELKTLQAYHKIFLVRTSLQKLKDCLWPQEGAVCSGTEQFVNHMLDTCYVYVNFVN